MAPTFPVLGLVCLILVQLSLEAPSDDDVKPQILAQFETILEVGNNFTVLCQGNNPLDWSWPDIADNNYTTWTRIHVEEVLPHDKGFKYATRLFLQNITYPFTGYYNCIDGNNTDSIYLYVKDEEHLSVKEEDGIDTILVTQYAELVIPCRPTSPDVQVELTLVDGEKVLLDITYEDGTVFRYHPHFGFVTNHTRKADQEYYVCTFIGNNRTSVVTVIVDVEPMIDSLAVPLLEETSGGHTVVGEKLVLECRVMAIVVVTFSWDTPTGKPDNIRKKVSTITREIDGSNVVVKQNLVVHNTTLKDSGLYHCNVNDNQNHHSSTQINVTVYDANSHFIYLTEANNILQINATARDDSIQWRVDVKAHPEPTLVWLNSKNETIENSPKYYTQFSSSVAILKINHIAITDFGSYTLVAYNQFETESLVLFLNVTDKPSVHLEIEDFYMVSKIPARVKCIVAAYPKPDIRWFFKPCQNNSCDFSEIKQSDSQEEGLQVISNAFIKRTHSGIVKCNASNALGADEDSQGFFMTDVRHGFDIFGFDETVDFNEKMGTAVIATGETIRIICAASVHNYTHLQWYRNGTILTQSSELSIERSFTEYSHRLTLIISNITSEKGGYYSCKVLSTDGDYSYKNVSLRVSEPSRPTITATNMDKDIEIELPRGVNFLCGVSGIPKPIVRWFKNDMPLLSTSRIKFQDSNQKLYFNSTTFEDEGTYKCEAFNKVGQVARQVNLKFKNRPITFNRWLLLAIVILVIIVILTTIFIVFKIRNEKKLQKELQIAGLANFEKGALENLNPELGIDDQAELLPYDKKWEFPIEKLKLGKQLGSGAFGVVMKGEAKGIVEDEEVTTVAVKMVKKNAGHTYIKALASELKIMVHLGKHLNVVNLLGACTKNVAKRELLVIVEYCRFGNVQNFLLRHRENFIDQVDPKTGHIDYTIGQEVLERSYSVSSTRSNSHSPLMKYAVMSFSNSNSGGSQVPQDMIDYRGNDYNGTTAKTDITTVSMNPSTGDEVIISNNSIQPEWRSNYKCDYKGTIKPICTKDLLAWAFQVSRGMEYLASRRVLHGDLAARNILLTDNNVVKICDFGLAKSMYKSDNYKKKGDGPLPVKWMAIESIRDKMFSTQSDVWSFGIVLWEFFSLARTPYPGMEADERLYNKLVDGYRMESPDYAPKEIYKMMLDCWQTKPLMRPSFTKVAERIGSMLEDTVRKHYIDLNDPYLVMNTQRLENGQSDYLAMLSPPNFENLSSPYFENLSSTHNYINDLPPSEDTPGYLCMKPTNIFSPRAEDERIFDFETAKNKKDKEKASGNELIPMLSVNSESDCESSTCNSPLVPNSFSNPSYHLPPVVEKDSNRSEKDLVKFSDNYVNMPQSKSALKETNPFGKIGKDGNEINYVNSSSRDWEKVHL